jgi:hypothetical protein
MRRLLLLTIVWLLVTSCTMGTMRREEVAQATLSPVPPTQAAQPTPTVEPTPKPTKPPAPTSAPTVVPTSAPTAIPTSAPTPAKKAAPGPAIVHFGANVEEADPGDTIVLEWETAGATRAILYRIPPSQQLPQSGWDVDTTGSYAYEIPFHDRNHVWFQLYAFDASDEYDVAYLTIYLRCPDPWFFSPPPEECPTAPVVSQAAEQHFEHGTMIWIEEKNRVYILYNDEVLSPKWESYNDEWDESQPEHDPEIIPPDGLYQPVRGFGLIWRQNPRVRERLGWAVDQERGFVTTVQHTTFFKYNSTYIGALDGNVWYLGPERSAWEKIVVD